MSHIIVLMPICKRIFDLFFSGVFLILLFPLMVIIVVIQYFADGKPVFFKQERPGYRGRPFIIYKFRTMKNLYDEEGELLPDADRMYPFGTFLRKSSLDELPELFHVLMGKMSIVGPRPLLMQYLPLYTDEQSRRHNVVPGITGWAQVNGRNAISWEEKFKLDVWYVDHWTFWLDIRIIILTLWKVVKRESISQIGEATMEKFAGTDSNSSV